jgi:hypothetical protein
MAGQNATENMGSAQDLINEALEKASVELDRTVKACIAELKNFSETLENRLAHNLEQMLEQSKHFAESNVEDLAAQREELVDQLADFERSEITTISTAAREVRQQISQKAKMAGDAIAAIVEQQIAELTTLVATPDKRFDTFTKDGGEALATALKASNRKIENQTVSYETELNDKAHQFEESVKGVLSTSKAGIQEVLDQHNKDLEVKIDSVIAQLSGVLQTAQTDMTSHAAKGQATLEASGEHGKSLMSSSLETWRGDCEKLDRNFLDTLTLESKDSEHEHAGRLDYKVNEVKAEISGIANDANVKLSTNHKMFLSSLKRLQKKYVDRLERLTTKFDAALAEEAKLPQTSAAGKTSPELRELLRARLQTRSKEIVKALQKQIEQIESEYSRYSAGSTERMENIKSSTIDSLEKQLKTMRNEIERITKNFHSQMTDMNADLPQIEEAGITAAMAVTAYRDARLSFGSE